MPILQVFLCAVEQLSFDDSLSVFVAVIVRKAAEGRPHRGVFEVGRLGHDFLDFVYLLLLLLFGGLISKDLIFRHEKGTSGCEGISTKVCGRLGGCRLLSTNTLSRRVRE